MSHVVTVYHPGGAQFRNVLSHEQSSTHATGVIEYDWTHTKDGKAEDLDALHLTPIAGKDSEGVSRYIRTNSDGKLTVSIQGDEVSLEDLLTASGLKVTDFESEEFLEKILAELIKQNIHLQSMTDERILDIDIETQGVI